MKIKTLTLLLCSLYPLAALANEGKAIDVAIPFAAQAQQIRTDLAGDTYAEINREDRVKVGDALGRLERVLGDGASIEGMSESQKVQLFNDQELVNITLTKARADSRVVCKREKTVGSHRAVSQCLTVAERRRIREESSELLQANQRDLSQPKVN